MCTFVPIFATLNDWVVLLFLFLDVLNKMNVITKTLQLADGRTITIETGKVAKQTDGAVMLTMNNTVLLATVCAAHHAWWTVYFVHFFPVTITQKYS